MITQKHLFRLLTYFTLLVCLTTCSANRFIFDPRTDIEPISPERAHLFEGVQFPTTEGLLLNGWYFQGPPDAPLLLYFHGNSTNLSKITEPLSVFTKLGVSIFAFDYRGYGLSEGQPTEHGTYEDARSALKYLKSRGWDSENMYYFGRSLGAAVATQLALETPPAGLVIESAFTSIQDMACYYTPLLCPVIRLTVDQHFYNNLEKLKRIHTPVLIFQGDIDEVVPPEMAISLYEAANSPKKLYLISGAGHSDTYQTGGQAYWAVWRQFLKRTVISLQ